MVSSATCTLTVFTYYLVYKFIQQYVYIDILKNGGSSFNSLWSRIIALTFNFIHSTVVELFFTSRTSRRILLSIYSSLLIIILHVSRQTFILEITFFTLNLTLCESLIFQSFLELWQIQLCLELSIAANYCIRDFKLHTGDVFLPIYVIWIFSVLLPHMDIDQPPPPSMDCYCIVIPPQPTIREKIKPYLYGSLQVCLLITYILVGCTTIRNTIFQIFSNKYSLLEVLLLVGIICVLVVSTYLMGKLGWKVKIILIALIVPVYYVVVFVLDTYHQTTFFTDIISKKLLSLTKCCITVFLTHDYRKNTYIGLHYRMVKFFILNSDSLSYIVNFILQDCIDVNCLNIYIVFIVLILYNLFIYC